MLELNGQYGNAKVYTNNIEPTAISQIITLLNQEAFEDSKVRIMPDVHAGSGCVIGFTANLGEKVIPNIVGVDIGCGMLTVDLGVVDFDLVGIDEFIKNSIPSGFNNNAIEQDMSEELRSRIIETSNRLGIDDLRPRLALGSLGGGNHFIEISKGFNGHKYLIIHTGSRNFGYQIATYYQKKAIEYLEEQRKAIKYKRKKEIGLLKQQCQTSMISSTKAIFDNCLNELKLPKELSYLEGDLRDEYLRDMETCQLFANESRVSIAKRIVSHIGLELFNLNNFQTIHNYISFEDNIVRKGAIRANKDELVLIPMNMRDGSLLCKGLGNEDWNNSAPHGAGRLMSRSKAKEVLSLDEFKFEMSNIYSTSVVQSTLDEAPMAYKPMEEIIENISDTVNVIDILKPIYNYKAH